MNAAAILAIPPTEPERLFRAAATVRADYRALVMKWHPDVNPAAQASEVLAHINALYRAAIDKLRNGTLHPPGEIELTGRDGRTRRIRYRVRRAFELGEMLIGMGLVTFLIGREHENLILEGLRCIGSMRYPDARFRASLEPHMPKVEKMFETETLTVICVRKRPEEVLLADLIAHLGGRIEPKHTAWIISSLLNLACYLEVSDMTVNALSPRTVFVSPTQHAVSLLGGWWYAAPVGKPIHALPPDTIGFASRRLRQHKIASQELDLESIRAIGRACLGDPTGGGLRTRSDVPAPMTQFLQLPSGTSAIGEYENWPKVLQASFGPRRYHELKITGDDVYPDGAK